MVIRDSKGRFMRVDPRTVASAAARRKNAESSSSGSYLGTLAARRRAAQSRGYTGPLTREEASRR